MKKKNITIVASLLMMALCSNLALAGNKTFEFKCAMDDLDEVYSFKLSYDGQGDFEKSSKGSVHIKLDHGLKSSTREGYKANYKNCDFHWREFTLLRFWLGTGFPPTLIDCGSNGELYIGNGYMDSRFSSGQDTGQQPLKFCFERGSDYL